MLTDGRTDGNLHAYVDSMSPVLKQVRQQAPHMKIPTCEQRTASQQKNRLEWSVEKKNLTVSFTDNILHKSFKYRYSGTSFNGHHITDTFLMPLYPLKILTPSSLVTRICTVCHSVCEFISTAWIKYSDWLKIGSGRGILIYSA